MYLHFKFYVKLIYDTKVTSKKNTCPRLRGQKIGQKIGQVFLEITWKHVVLSDPTFKSKLPCYFRIGNNFSYFQESIMLSLLEKLHFRMFFHVVKPKATPMLKFNFQMSFLKVEKLPPSFHKPHPKNLPTNNSHSLLATKLVHSSM